ncbi:MAG: 16S rRNA (cytosine(1402)-N(4))-methyltransferase RsmH [Candidatus Bipolaricaulis sp.]|nr:16S rRNA (cytosine(1402)-N(4))-methyltransferase RsmH [Candidatus Bipolaricaulis sp.]MDD5219948.1 16S rRNA (cytosine(1402)-N(4))-methyltransferase RsmH [Candidatus Bipolaricaulis sp.]MDD5645878.1 16S rRNA (cytosine(1402)-N(4))-methyltransferase RsmH [Candidatus Bipolaricaulis sp.]
MSGREERAHIPVLVGDVVRLVSPRPNAIVVDGTVGLGGHAEAFLEAEPTVCVVGIDRDEAALERARGRLSRFGSRALLVHGEYADVGALLDRHGIGPIDGFLLDLGVSSLQLDDEARGFSFRGDGPLDMRMDRSCGVSAAEWLAVVDPARLERVLREYGEERYAWRIAQAIVRERSLRPIETTAHLRALVHRAAPSAYFAQRIDPATRTFQAVRIAINGELDQLTVGLERGFARLSRGGVLAVISFHSLEDRIVKGYVRERAAACVCPPDFPTCVCGKRVEAEILTPKPITPSDEEVAANPRARSAKLRACRKVVDFEP